VSGNSRCNLPTRGGSSTRLLLAQSQTAHADARANAPACTLALDVAYQCKNVHAPLGRPEPSRELLAARPPGPARPPSHLGVTVGQPKATQRSGVGYRVRPNMQPCDGIVRAHTVAPLRPRRTPLDARSHYLGGTAPADGFMGRDLDTRADEVSEVDKAMAGYGDANIKYIVAGIVLLSFVSYHDFSRRVPEAGTPPMNRPDPSGWYQRCAYSRVAQSHPDRPAKTPDASDIGPETMKISQCAPTPPERAVRAHRRAALRLGLASGLDHASGL
jgi:hypothetical protein